MYKRSLLCCKLKQYIKTSKFPMSVNECLACAVTFKPLEKKTRENRTIPDKLIFIFAIFFSFL